MTTINDTFINAVLADASYVDVGRLSDLKADLAPRMTPTLADYIAKNFSVLTSVSTPGALGSAFDATVWKGNAGTDFAGKVYISMRGTQQLQDFVDDASLAFGGAVGNQLVDMVNWWLRVSTPAGQAARQIQWSPTQNSAGWFAQAPSTTGTGEVSAADLVNGRVEVDGHSLGGYLASAFTRLFGAQAHVTQTTTFNSAGFAPGSEDIFKQLEQMIGSGYGIGHFAAAGSSSQINVFAEHGFNFTTNSFWFSQVGQRVELFNEESGSQIPNHYMYKLTDSLALAVAMKKLDPSMSTDRANSFFEGGSNVVAGSIEGVLDGLRRLLLEPKAAALPIGDVSDSASSRVTYHQTLKQLQDSAAFASLAGKVRVDLSSIDLHAKARNDFSSLASLITLSPVVVSATNTANQIVLDNALRPVWGQTYTDWQTDKSMSLADRQLGKETYTDSWMRDRATLLDALALRNKRDSDNGVVVADASLSSDKTYEFQFYGGVPRAGETLPPLQVLMAAHLPGALLPIQRVAFGDDTDNRVDGTNYKLGDHLYGGAGNDILSGLSGDDYLEGNADNDTLDGGDGNDTLLGGAGTDLYKFTGPWGRDTIEDSDGLGTLQVEGFAAGLPQGKKLGTGKYQSTDSKVTYTLAKITDTRTDLAIAFTGRTDTLTIRNWSPGQFGITFDEVPVPSTSVVMGDTKPDINDVLAGTSGADQILGLSGNDALSGGDGNDVIEGGIGTDILAGGSGADVLNGGDGNDYFFGSGSVSQGWNAAYPDWLVPGPNGREFRGVSLPVPNDDGNVIDAGAGNDLVFAGTGNDVVRGGTGIDQVFGMGGSDYIDGGDDADELHGDASVVFASYSYLYSPPERHGNDTLVGGGGNDTLFGEGGADEIYGGADNDVINGDARIQDVPVEFHGNDYLDGGDGDDQLWGDGGNDELFGGTGNDTLQGDARADDLPGSAHGADYLDGEEGNDVLFGAGGAGTLYGGDGNYTLGGDDDVSRLASASHGNDYLDGQGGDDILWGGDGDDWLAGEDELSSTAVNALTGNDWLEGGAGADTLIGGNGNDRLFGNCDSTALFSEAGTDPYKFSRSWGEDTTQCSDGQSTIQVDGIGSLGSSCSQKLAEGSWQSTDKNNYCNEMSVDASRSNLIINATNEGVFACAA